jgi:hypothetical protein
MLNKCFLQTRWKVVLLKDPKDTRVASEVDDRPELQCFTIGRDKEHLGLIRDKGAREEEKELYN